MPHLVIAGCPRSGTSLLMHSIRRLDNCFVADGECMYDQRAADYMRDVRCDLPVAWTVTKRPRDFERLPSILSADPEARGLVILRDGRDVVCSRHPKKPDLYIVNPKRWHSYARLLHTLHRDERIYALRYEKFVSDYEWHMREIAQWMGCPLVGTWADVCDQLDPLNPVVQAMNGVRPVSRGRIGVWRDPEHAERVLRVGNILTEQLLAWGYEQDPHWMRRITAGHGARA